MKILIIQTAFIGDVILATAVAEKLHQQYPDAQIDFVLRKGNEALLSNHPFADNRYEEANKNLALLKNALAHGDLELFTQVVEQEAMMLHAMMMTSNPYFLLMKPNTLAIIQKVWEHRKQSGLSMVITLDAGANVHLLYPAEEKSKVVAFIVNELSRYCADNYYIHDHVGNGPEQMI